MIKDINPLDWHNARYVDYIPEHFTKLKLKSSTDMPRLLEWVTNNASGRYSICTNTSQRTGLSFISEERSIGFENPEDATMFTLFYK